MTHPVNLKYLADYAILREGRIGKFVKLGGVKIQVMADKAIKAGDSNCDKCAIPKLRGTDFDCSAKCCSADVRPDGKDCWYKKADKKVKP